MTDKPRTRCLGIRQTVIGLEYIMASPPRKYGGFHEQAIETARSALHHIRWLREQTKGKGAER